MTLAAKLSGVKPGSEHHSIGDTTADLFDHPSLDAANIAALMLELVEGQENGDRATEAASFAKESPAAAGHKWSIKERPEVTDFPHVSLSVTSRRVDCCLSRP